MTTLTIGSLTEPVIRPAAASSVRVVRPTRRAVGYERHARGPVACDGSFPPDLHGSRLTSRGRVVVAVVWLLMAAVAAFPLFRSDDVQRPVTTTTTIVVEPGDTLWTLADEIDPAADPRTVVDAIVELNGLRSGGDIYPGDLLVIPGFG
jgi:nucleoid-associated protein YgaU